MKIFLYLTIFLIVACNSYTNPKVPAKLADAELKNSSLGDAEPSLIDLNTILVLPLDFDRSIIREEIKEFGLYKLVADSFKSELGINLVWGEKIQTLRKEISASSQINHAQAVKIGKRLSVDAVLHTYVTTYEPRVGSKIGVSEPASAGFQVTLLRVSDGREIWNSTFFQKDKALSEDLFRLGQVLKNGAGWRTSDEILKEGFVLASQDLAIKRNKQFLRSSK